MRPTSILETVLYAEDLAAAEDFYVRMLGLTVDQRVPGRHVFFKLDASMLLIFNPKATIVPHPSTARLPVPAHGALGAGHVCFRATAAEIDAWRAHLEAKGVAIEQDFVWPSGGRSIYFRDPAGNSVEFAEAKIWNFQK